MALTDPASERHGATLSAVAPSPRAPWLRRSMHVALLAVVAGTTAACVVLMFVSRGALWLDEAQSVAIGRLPIRSLFDALRQDGAPPLYYLLLHGWMKLFGESTGAVRTMSGLFSVGSLGVMWALVHRVRGARTACYATALLATSPFTVRYATETRMYALVILLVLLGALAVRRAIEDPTVGRLVAVSLVSGALLLTHYWALYLVAATLAILANEARHRRPWAKRVTVAVAAGGIAFVPWLPSFVYQMRHTGAPWAQTATFGHVLDSLRAYAAPGALDSAGWLLWLALLGLVVLGVFASPRRRRSIELRWPGRAPARQLALITVGVLALALAIGVVTHSPVTSRYTAVVFPLVILLAALGLGTFGRTTALVVLTIATVSGLAGSADAARTARTEVPRVVATLAEQAAPGDLVVYCPDQLGPSTSRLIRSDVRQVTFPNLADPQRVDWVDYREHVDATDVETFAWQVNALAGTGDLWLVTAPNYTTMSPTCRALRHEIEALRPRSSELVTADGNFLEQAQLFRMRPNTAVTTAGS